MLICATESHAINFLCQTRRKNKLTYAENKYIIKSLRNTEKIDREVANNLIGLDREWLLPFFSLLGGDQNAENGTRRRARA